MDALDKVLEPYENQANFNKDNRFDFSTNIKVINGELREKYIFDIITDENITHEVKSESKYSWTKYGNVYFEYAQMKYGKWVHSGISATTADYWWIDMKDWEDEQPSVGRMVFETEVLKARLHKLLEMGIAKKSGKAKTEDGSATLGLLVPILSLFYYEQEIEEREKQDDEIKEQYKIKRIKELAKNKKNI